MKVQHYYPFGMLMPGRYVSDTTGKCMTISQTKWVTTIVDSCMDVTIYPPSTEGSGGYEIFPWGDIVLTIPGPGDAVGFNVNGLVPGVAQDIVLNFTDINSGTAYVQVIEQVNGVPVVLGSLSTSIKGIYSVKVTPTTQTSVDVVVHGPVEGTMGQLCHKIPKLTQQTMLVDVCNDVKDRYRFGFNGQEKVNEWAGVGNHNTAMFWEYDTRTGRRLNLDPVDQINVSNYAAFVNNPIIYTDALGNIVKVANYYFQKTAGSEKNEIHNVFYKANERKKFETEWQRSKKMMNDNGFGDLAEYMEASSELITVVQMTGDLASFWEPGTNTLYFNPRGGLEKDGIMLSPITVLIHEMDHGVDDLKFPQEHKNREDEEDAAYTNAEERRVITGIEQKAALIFGDIKPGQVTRTAHDGKIFISRDLNSNKKANAMGWDVVPVGEAGEPKPKPNTPQSSSSKPTGTTRVGEGDPIKWNEVK